MNIKYATYLKPLVILMLTPTHIIPWHEYVQYLHIYTFGDIRLLLCDSETLHFILSYYHLRYKLGLGTIKSRILKSCFRSLVI